MKMKFNWGTGIFIVIVLFLLVVIAFFIFINTLDINLVEDNYYEKELVYQERIEKINNTASLTGKINISIEPGILIIQFPAIDSTFSPSGSVLLYRPSDPKKDLTLPLHLDNSLRQIVDISSINKGKWIVKLEWEMGGKAYYFEEGLILQ
jgi:hypothetical protein